MAPEINPKDSPSLIPEEQLKSVKELLGKEVEDAKIKKTSIPNGSLVEALLYNVDYTKKAIDTANIESRNPNLLDGINLKWVILKYYPVNKDGTLSPGVQLVELTNSDVEFPGDIVNIDGTITYAPIEIYEPLTPKMLTSNYNPGGPLVAPTTERLAAILYNAVFETKYRRNNLELLLTILACGLGDKMNLDISGYPQISYEAFKIPRPSVPLFPIIPAYRVVEKVYTKDQIGPDKKPLEGAKPSFKVKLVPYRLDPNTNEKVYDLDTIPTKWMDADKVGRIIMGLLNRSDVRNVDKTPF